MRRFCVLSLVCAALLWPSAAKAGGWWSEVNVRHRYVAIGHKVFVNSVHYFTSERENERAQDGHPAYFAYLVKNVDSAITYGLQDPQNGRWWQPFDGPMWKLGRIDIVGVRAQGAFELPDVAPGRYWIMLCSTGCERAYNDAVPTRLFIVETQVTAQAASRADYAQHELMSVNYQLRRDRRAMERASHRARRRSIQLEMELATTTDRMRKLSAEVRAKDGDLGGFFVLSGAIVAGALVIALARRRVGPAPGPSAYLGRPGGYVARSRPARSARDRRPRVRSRSLD